jgi:hypothetical protein
MGILLPIMGMPQIDETLAFIDESNKRIARMEAEAARTKDLKAASGAPPPP